MAKLKCLDTYTLYEISQGNPKFSKYLKGDFVITDITLAEFYGVILRNHNEQTADYWFRKLEHYSMSINRSILIEAVKFRFRHKRLLISFFDAVGYIFALRKGRLFVTGDREFENFRNVEFQKK